MDKNIQSQKTRIMILTALSAALICILGPLSLPIPVSPVPISITQFGIYFAVYTLDRKNSTVSVVLYLLIGMIGLPVFSGFSGGLAKLAGPTGGYLIGFIFMTYIAAYSVERFEDNVALVFTGFILANALCYIFGSLWLSVQAALPLKEAFAMGCVPYIPADIIKIAAAMIIGPKLRRATRKYYTEAKLQEES